MCPISAVPSIQKYLTVGFHQKTGLIFAPANSTNVLPGSKIVLGGMGAWTPKKLDFKVFSLFLLAT